jgi:hypothetical protein
MLLQSAQVPKDVNKVMARFVATAPRDDRRPIFIIMAPAGLTLLAATTRAVS